jgi:hypothetical protein
MLAQLAQATYDYTYTNVKANGAIGGLMAFLAAYFVFLLAIAVFMVVIMWVLYKKAGRNGWEAIVPIYNGWVYCEVAGRPGWWVFLFLLAIIPVVGPLLALAVHVVLAIDFAKSFGKEPVWAVLLVLLPVVGYAILAFDKKVKYVGPAAKSGGNTGATPAAPATK